MPLFDFLCQRDMEGVFSCQYISALSKAGMCFPVSVSYSEFHVKSHSNAIHAKCQYIFKNEVVHLQRFSEYVSMVCAL